MESSDSDIEKCSSFSSTPESYDTVPDDMEFKFRMFGSGCAKNGSKIAIDVIKGKELPYETKRKLKIGKVFNVSISKCLLPSIDGFTRKYQDGWWIFTDSSVSDTSLTQASCGPNTDVLAQPDSSATGMPSASGCGSSFSDDSLNILQFPLHRPLQSQKCYQLS